MDYITGASGFLGSRLKEALEKKRRVVAIPHEEIPNQKNLVCSNFYFLSTYGNMHHHKDDDQIFQANLTDLTHILTNINLDTLHSFVFVSTSSVKRPVQTMYSRTKKAAEEVLLAVMEKYKVPVCIIRPMSITGVGEQKEHLIPMLIDAAFTGKRIVLVEDPVHDWIDVDDVVEAIITLSSKRAKGIFEVGTGTATSNRKVKEMVELVTQSKITCELVSELRDYDGEDWVSSNFRARSYGWSPKKILVESITEMVKAYEKI